MYRLYSLRFVIHSYTNVYTMTIIIGQRAKMFTCNIDIAIRFSLVVYTPSRLCYGGVNYPEANIRRITGI